MRASSWPLCFVFIVDLLARSFPVILVGPLQTCKLCLTIFGMETIMGVAELLQNVWRTIMVCGQIWNNGSWVLTWKTIYLNQNIFHKSLRRCLQRQSYCKNIHPPGGLLVNKCRQNNLNNLIRLLWQQDECSRQLLTNQRLPFYYSYSKAFTIGPLEGKAFAT